MKLSEVTSGVGALLLKGIVPSREGRLLFYSTAFVHMAMKVLLGLVMVFDDHYGLQSMVAPPQSIVLAASDVLLWFVFCRALDTIRLNRSRRVVEAFLLYSLFAFLTVNFIVHRYFKGFVNRGLLEFNGAAGHELFDYAFARVDSFCIGFIAIASVTSVSSTVWRKAMLEQTWLGSDALLAGVLAYAVFGTVYANDLSAGQSGFMAKDPTYVLAHSYLVEPSSRVPRLTPEQVRRFQPSGPRHGSYDSALDVEPLQIPGANVLFVLIESLPFEQTSLGGAEGLPVLAELANNGISFTNFRTVFPATSRSFMTYHCGIYPNAGPSAATKYQPGYDCDSFLKVLRQNGYRTGFFTAPMFTYDNMHRSGIVRDYDEYQDFLSLHPEAALNGIDAPAVEEEVVVRSLLHFVREPSPKPYFATYFMFWNHAPYRLPFEDISKLPPLDRYHRTLAYLDRMMRGVLQEIEATGKPTIVIVAADHGEGFGLHHGNFNHAGHIYEDDVHVPFLVHVPGLGRHASARQASNVDFAPTLMGLLGLPKQARWQGQDLLAREFRPRPTLLFGRAAEVTNGLVDGNLKYIEYPATQARLLFDLARDPLEQHDLIGKQPAIADEYRALVRAWLPVVETQAWTAAK